VGFARGPRTSPIKHPDRAKPNIQILPFNRTVARVLAKTFSVAFLSGGIAFLSTSSRVDSMGITEQLNQFAVYQAWRLVSHLAMVVVKWPAANNRSKALC
jgi:hypothetical protein